MQYDVLATKPLTSTGDFKDQADSSIGRARIKTIYCVNGANAGSVVIREGGASGRVLITVNTSTAASSGTTMILLPGEGILCQSNLHGTVTDVASITLIYG